MAAINCAKCSFRARYDRNPKSLLGRLWRWHVGWCPGWKSFMSSLDQDEQVRLADKYDLKKYKDASVS